MQLIALCVAFLAFQAQPDLRADAVKDELKKLQGTWQVELQNEDGKKLTDADVKGRTITFGANLFIVRHNSAMVQIGKLKVDPTKDVKTINATIEKGANAGDIMPGIYERDGNTLKICLSTDGEGRPKEFKEGPNLLLMVCKRAPAQKDERDLSGQYKSESTDIAGKRIRYDATIERMGEGYLVLYTVQGKVVYFGTGIRKGNVFAMCWTSLGQPGLTLYQIGEGNRMTGEFAELGGPGFFGSESLTPVPKDY